MSLFPFSLSRSVRVAACSLAIFFPISALAAPSDKDRMVGLLRYGDTILKHGLDTYGKRHTPLIVDYLDVSTLKAPEKMYIHRLGGPGPRSKQSFQPVISSNLGYQGNLMRFLVGLSNLTGDPKYKEAYKKNIQYYYDHYRTPNGLLHMGHHRWVNVKADRWDGNDWPPGGSGHEMKRDYPYYPIFWETDPKAARRMLAAHWSSHIQDWGFMNFTRHGSYVKELNEEALWDQPRTEPVKGVVPGNLTFFDSGSDIIYAGAQLGILNNDERPRYWAQRLYARYAESAHPDTGIPPWHHTSLRTFGQAEAPVPEYALITAGTAGLMNGGGVAMLRLGEELGKQGAFYRETMVNNLKAYAKHCYRPETNDMRIVLYDGTDLAERDKKLAAEKGEEPTNQWTPWTPSPVNITAYAICYKQSKDVEIWKTLRAMCRGWDLGDIGEPGGTGVKLNLETKETKYLFIFPLVELFEATKKKEYLALAKRIANNSFAQQYRAEQGLFTPSELHRTANLCSAQPLALLTLEAALQGKLDQVPSYSGSNEAEERPYLRPLKTRPYNPTVSHLAYSFAPKAMCDDLLPKSSADTSVPVMSWRRVRKATDEAIVTFPDIAKGPVTIEGMIDDPEARNSVSGMIIDSPHQHTFTGNLNGTGDLNIKIAKGEHVWAEGATWTTTAWSTTETYDLVLDIAKGAKLTFGGLVQEVNGAWKWGRGAGILKNGAGTLELTGDNRPLYSSNLNGNRSYRAPTVINEGTLLVNNETGSGTSPRSLVQVNHGAVLGGSGTIGRGGTSALVEVNPGGTIKPGNGKALGTLTLKDGLTLHDGARLEFDVGEKFDALHITGGTFRGSGKDGVLITIKNNGKIERGKSYDIIDWTGASFVDVDLSDFRLDKSQDWQGTFYLDGTKLRFSIFAPRIFPEKPIPMPPKPGPKPSTQPEPFDTGHGPRPITHFTWSNPKGGKWTDRANWTEGRIPNTKEAEWAQYEFEKARNVSGVKVYWFDNGHDRKLPESWRLLYQEGDDWKPVDGASAYGLEKDTFNNVNFKPVTTKRLRLEVQLQPGLSSGVQEWQVLP